MLDNKVRTGSPTPTFSRVPEAFSTSAFECISLARSYGVTLFEWQENVIHGWLGENKVGDWISTICGLCVARQNGKGEVLLARELFGLVVLGERIIHTAHLGRTADDALSRLYGIFKANPDLNAMISRHSEAASRGFLELKNGGRVDFATRSKDAGRGLSLDLVVIDEAQECTAQELQALQFTLSARPNTQLILVGTVPAPEANGEVFTKYRNNAVKGTSDRMAWLEWCGAWDCDLDDIENWYLTNPSLGILISEQTILDERMGQDDDGFGRERLSIWTPGGSKRVISEEIWDAQGDTNSKAVADLALAIDVTPDRQTAVVALAGKRTDGNYHIEKYEARAGIGWVVEYVTNIVEKNDIRAVVIDAKSAAVNLLDDFKKYGVKVTITHEREMATACANFYDGLVEGWLFHIVQPECGLAVSNLRKRPLLGGEAFAWNRKNLQTDISPVVAMTLALFGSMNSKVRKPGGKKKSSQRLITLPM